MIRTNSQNKILHSLLGTLNIPIDIKEGLVYKHTNERTISSSQMSQEECQGLINYLNHLKSTQIKSQEPRSETQDARAKQRASEQKMRMKVISLCHEMNMRLPNGKIDMTRVDKLCEERGYKHKKLNDYKYSELQLLITQIERITKDYLKTK